jgi:CheY-like chemotaxis protein
MSLSAKVELNFPASGLTWQLRCAAAEVLDGGGASVLTAKGETPDDSGMLTSSRPRILIVEDETLVAIEIAQVLNGAGFDVVGPVRSVCAALELLERSGCDAAVLDINLGTETSEPVALALRKHGTPFVTMSGYARDQYPPAYKGGLALTKPVRPELLIAELRKRTGIKIQEAMDAVILVAQ